MLDKFIRAKNVTAQQDYKIRIHLLAEVLEDAEANVLETSENSLHKHFVSNNEVKLKALLEKLLEENMCSVVGDELIEEVLKSL